MRIHCMHVYTDVYLSVLYRFFLHVICDKYIEVALRHLMSKVLLLKKKELEYITEPPWICTLPTWQTRSMVCRHILSLPLTINVMQSESRFIASCC